MKQTSIIEMGEVYCIDAGVFIEMWRGGYNFKTFPGLKTEMEKLASEGRLVTTQEVLIELGRKEEDGLRKWVASLGVKQLITQEQADIVGEIMENHPGLINSRSLVEEADPYVIAMAEADDLTLVTTEALRGGTVNPSIPDVCNVRGVKWLSHKDFVTQQGWKFISA